MFFSCEEQSSNKQITAFGFAVPPAVGVIDEGAKSIAVEVPLSTDVSALIPVIAISDKATISPASGVAQNFTNSVTYTVTAEDGSAANYVVTVTVGVGGGGQPVELTSPITVNTTLKDLGLPIDYVYKGSGLLAVQNNAILTIEPGVTIQFTDNNCRGGIEIKDGATIKAIGTADKRIQFVGNPSVGIGSWDEIAVRTKTANEFAYCDFIDAGSRTDAFNYAAAMYIYNAKVGVSYCKVSGGKCYGITFLDDFTITAFNNNKVENCSATPVCVRGQLARLGKFDVTSDFTNNTKAYITVYPYASEVGTLNETSVPYYFDDNLDGIHENLTIGAGVTIYLGQNNYIGTGQTSTGRLLIHGTVAKPVKFTRIPGTTYYWKMLHFMTGVSHEMKNCIVEYGGFDENDGSINLMFNGNVAFENVHVSNSKGRGIMLNNHNNISWTGGSTVTFGTGANANAGCNVVTTDTYPNPCLDAMA
jgi:hypothetical protein